MTSSGRRWAFAIGIVIALALPKRVEDTYGRCTRYQVKPLGFYLLEHLTGNLGVAYSSGQDCR